MTRLLWIERVVATPGALERAEENGIDVGGLIDRHVLGDWGDLDEADTRQNENALKHGGRVFSAYGEGSKRLYVITEADRSVTTVLRPEDY